MKCKEFKKYLKEWVKSTPRDKRLDDKYNIRPTEINEHIDACDRCFHKLLEVLGDSASKPEPASNVVILKEPWEDEL